MSDGYLLPQQLILRGQFYAVIWFLRTSSNENRPYTWKGWLGNITRSERFSSWLRRSVTGRVIGWRSWVSQILTRRIIAQSGLCASK